jgi:hypothetical protein
MNGSFADSAELRDKVVARLKEKSVYSLSQINRLIKFFTPKFVLPLLSVINLDS